MQQPKKKASTTPKASAVSTMKKVEKYTTTNKKTGNKSTSIKKKTVDDAKTGKNYFAGKGRKEGDYKGTVVKGKKGEVTGVKTNDGKFVRATTPEERKKALETLAYDKKKFQSDTKKFSKTKKRFKTATKN